MTNARIIDSRGNVEEVSASTFFERVFGHPPPDKAQRQARADAYWAEQRIKHAEETALYRERLLAMLSPEGAARVRAKWEVPYTRFSFRTLDDGREQVAA